MSWPSYVLSFSSLVQPNAQLLLRLGSGSLTAQAQPSMPFIPPMPNSQHHNVRVEESKLAGLTLARNFQDQLVIRLKAPTGVLPQKIEHGY